MVRSILLLLGLMTSVSIIFGQEEIELINPSFEAVSGSQGAAGAFQLNGWMDCGHRMPSQESPPDIHPGNLESGGFWNVRRFPSDGFTYLGLVVRDNDTWEGISQRLSKPLQGGKCYEVSLDMAQSERYWSHSRIFENKAVNYVTPAVLRVWGGDGFCNQAQLLLESDPINHKDWKRYTFKIEPKRDYRYILIEAFFVTPVIYPYCGHVLVDNMSSIKEVPCEEEEDGELIAASDNSNTSNALPPHKRGRVEKAKQKPVETAKPDKPKLLEDLDIKKIREGSIVEIKNLYFKADTSTINETSYDVLDEVYGFLKENPQVVVEIGGHTNGLPTHEYCDKLSSERAKAVYDYLLDKGIKRDKITYKGYGKRRRIASDRTPEGRKKNQRVEIKVLSVG